MYLAFGIGCLISLEYTIVLSADWNNLVIGKLSPYIDVDSKYPIVRTNSEHTLYQELALASHLGLPAITFKLTSGIDENANLARIMNDKMSNSMFQVSQVSQTIQYLLIFILYII